MIDNFINDSDLEELKAMIREKTKEVPDLIIESDNDTEEDKARYFYARYYKEVCKVKRYANANLNNFNIRKGSVVFNYVKNFKENIDNGMGLILCGNVGNGKTRLSFALIRLFIEVYNDYKGLNSKVIKPIRVKYTDIFENLWSKTQDKDYYKEYTTCNFLVIDDFLSKDSESKGYQDTIYKILDSRYENMKTTIFTANFTSEAFKEKVQQRVYDRMINTNHIIEIKAKSRRSEFDKLSLDEL